MENVPGTRRTWGETPTATFSNYQTWRVWVDVISQLDTYELRDNLAGLDATAAGVMLEAYIDGLIYPPGRESETTVVRGWAKAFTSGVDWAELAAVVLDDIGA